MGRSEFLLGWTRFCFKRRYKEMSLLTLENVTMKSRRTHRSEGM